MCELLESMPGATPVAHGSADTSKSPVKYSLYTCALPARPRLSALFVTDAPPLLDTIGRSLSAESTCKADASKLRQAVVSVSPPLLLETCSR